jgi:hypothetical protein
VYCAKPLKQAIARHYYDIFMLARKGVAAEAAKNKALLEAVVYNSRLNCTNSNESDTYKAFDELLQQKIRLVPATWAIGDEIYRQTKHTCLRPKHTCLIAKFL